MTRPPDFPRGGERETGGEERGKNRGNPIQSRAKDGSSSVYVSVFNM